MPGDSAMTIAFGIKNVGYFCFSIFVADDFIDIWMPSSKPGDIAWHSDARPVRNIS